MTSRRFPAPWRADTIPGGYVVRDASGQSIAYVYSRETEAEARQANVLTKDEARRVAVNIARLRSCLGRPIANMAEATRPVCVLCRRDDAECLRS
jgi:hypothetical protein